RLMEELVEACTHDPANERRAWQQHGDLNHLFCFNKRSKPAAHFRRLLRFRDGTVKRHPWWLYTKDRDECASGRLDLPVDGSGTEIRVFEEEMPLGVIQLVKPDLFLAIPSIKRPTTPISDAHEIEVGLAGFGGKAVHVDLQ